MRQIMLAINAAVVVLAATSPTTGRERHPRVLSGGVATTPSASRFYPDEIAGGVKGNLPFNNQIRKLKDPLNANGAK